MASSCGNIEPGASTRRWEKVSDVIEEILRR